MNITVTKETKLGEKTICNSVSVEIEADPKGYEIADRIRMILRSTVETIEALAHAENVSPEHPEAP